MDKLTLSREQLKELKFYIYKKGFRDPEVQAEILDHFACKVEEVLTANPYMNFDAAMRKAHHEFGYRGFEGIRATMEAFYKSRYRKIYWQEVKSILTSIPHLVILIFIAWLTFKGVTWAGRNQVHDFLGYNIVSESIFAFTVLAQLMKVFIVRNMQKAFCIKIAWRMSSWTFTTAYFWISISTSSTSERKILISAIATTLLLSWNIVNYIADYKRLKTAEADYMEFESFHQQESLTL